MRKIYLLEKIALTGTAATTLMAADIGCAGNEYRFVKQNTDEYTRICHILSVNPEEKPIIRLVLREDGTYCATIRTKLTKDQTPTTPLEKSCVLANKDLIGTRLGENPRNVALIDGLNAHYSSLIAQMRQDGYCMPAQMTELAINYRNIQALLNDKKALDQTGWANTQLTSILKKYDVFEKLVRPNSDNGVLQLQINIERDHSKSTGWIPANITASELEEISKEVYSGTVEHYGDANGLYLRTAEAAEMINAIIGKKGCVGQNTQAIDKEILSQINVTACRIRMASPESAKIDTKQLFETADNNAENSGENQNSSEQCMRGLKKVMDSALQDTEQLMSDLRFAVLKKQLKKSMEKLEESIKKAQH